MHVKEGEIRAYHDQELSAWRTAQVKEHLESCPKCRVRAAALLEHTQRVHSRLVSLDPNLSHPQTTPQAVRARLAAQLAQTNKENFSMKKLSIPRPVWIGLAVIAILAVSLSFAPVRAIANNFLGLFRVEQIRVVEVNPATFPDNLGNSSQLEQMMTENVQFEGNGEPQPVADATEASELAGMSVRLPTNIEGTPTLIVQPGGKATFNVDLELVQAILKDLNRPDIVLPKDLDGATVTFEISAGVLAQYGECDLEKLEGRPDPDDPAEMERFASEFQCITLLQVPSPTISAPADLNISQIGEAYLQVLGMSREDAANFAQNVDWTTTFVVPIPRYNVEYTEVQVDGVIGTLMATKGYNKEFVLLWVKDGFLYVLSGPGVSEQALDIANSLP